MKLKLFLLVFLVAMLLLELDARKPPRKGRKGRKGKGHHHHHHHHHHKGKGSKGVIVGFDFKLGSFHDKGKGGGWGGWGKAELPPLRLPKLKIAKPKIKLVPWRLKLLRPKLIVKGPRFKVY